MSFYYRLMCRWHGITPERAAFIASDAFLQSYEWRQIRYKALDANDGRCECCARNKHQLLVGEFLDVDHVYNRRAYPWVALNPRRLQILCRACNHGKGNTKRDWRHKHHPYREGK